jgi:hypothetical protein
MSASDTPLISLRELAGLRAELTAANAKLEKQAVRLREANSKSAKLWKLLDDIDTASDRYKSNYEGLAEYVYKTQRKRFEIMTGEQFDAAIDTARGKL